MESLLVPSGSTNIAVAHHGSGPPVMLLHAGVADNRSWRDVMEGLVGVRTIAYDRRGFGATTYEEQEHRQIDDLVTVMDAMDADRAVLVGCSRGGQIAFSAALSIPQRITKLVLIDSAPAGAPDAEAPLPPALAALFDAIDRAEEDDDTDELNRLEAHLWLDGPMQPEGRVAGEARDVFLDMNRTVLLAPPIGDTEDLAGWDRLGDVTQPTLIVAGAFDLPLLVERCRAMAAIVPRARYVELSRSAHLPMLDDAPALVAALQMFLDDDG